MTKYNPLTQLVLGRIRQFFREPEAIFWTYGFPVLMVVGLGIAFRTKPADRIAVGVEESPAAIAVIEHLESATVDGPDGTAQPRFDVRVHPSTESLDHLRQNRVAVVVVVEPDGAYTYRFDPTNPESQAAREASDNCLQEAAGRTNPVTIREELLSIPGSRYVDFLVPGLIGMNLMSGGMWGIGFVLVDMRVRNLLKRLVATPMRRRDFLLSMVGVRALFFIPEMVFLLLAAWLLFGVHVNGSVFSLLLIGFVGAVSFAGLGLLTACRAQRIETISGLMNVIMLPMWVMSGVFFSSDRFPDVIQPFVRALPLTQLIDAMRAVAIEGASLASQFGAVAILVAWGVVSFALALRWFRWQ
jgi:ABC-type multidrug transport system permease subunit